MPNPRTWTIHTDDECLAWRQRLAEHFPLASQHRLLKLALKYGLRSAALHPELLVEEACTDNRDSESIESVVRTTAENG